MLLYLLHDLLLVAVSTIGVIFGFKVRSGNNAAGMLTIVGWGIVLGNRVAFVLIWRGLYPEFLNYGIFGGFDDLLRMLLSAGFLTDPMATVCVLLGILRLASSDTNFGNARSFSTRYKPLDLYATGDR